MPSSKSLGLRFIVIELNGFKANLDGLENWEFHLSLHVAICHQLVPMRYHYTVYVIKSVLYHGENFQVENSDKVNCNIIRAKWLKVGFPLVIDPKEKFARSGTIQRILLTQHIMNGVKQHMVLFDVDWFSMHDEPYAYGHHVHIYHKNVSNQVHTR